MGQGHSHGGGSTRNERLVAFGACLTGAFMLAEVVGGLILGSLALIAGAADMLHDSTALIFAWAAFPLARRAAEWRDSCGFERGEVSAWLREGVNLVGAGGAGGTRRG